MSLFGKADQANNAPKNVVDDKNNTGTDQYGNTVYAVDTTEAGVTAGVAHSGWVRRTVGTGPITSFVLYAPGTGYSNADTIDVEGGTGANATGSVVTDASGNLVSASITYEGAGFENAGAATLTINTSGGSGANVGVTVGGRAGRTFIETLVASGSITGDGSDDTVFPDA